MFLFALRSWVILSIKCFHSYVTPKQALTSAAFKGHGCSRKNSMEDSLLAICYIYIYIHQISSKGREKQHEFYYFKPKVTLNIANDILKVY